MSIRYQEHLDDQTGQAGMLRVRADHHDIEQDGKAEAPPAEVGQAYTRAPSDSGGER